MFSKPIMIAASVAAANATLLTASKGAHGATTTKSDKTGCGLCLRMTSANAYPKFIIGSQTMTTAGAKYTTPTASTTVAVGTGDWANQITGEFCCGDPTTAATQEAAGTTVFCTKGVEAWSDTNKKRHSSFTLASTDFVQSALAQCPHDVSNCAAVVKTKADVAVTPDDARYIKLAALGTYATLTVNVRATADASTAPSMKQRKGDVCTWIVETLCEAPVITVVTGSDAITTSAVEVVIQVLEWSAEYIASTDTQAPAPWAVTAQSGVSSTKLYYPPLATDLSAKITDLLLVTTVSKNPNNLLGAVSYNKVASTTVYAYQSVPGTALVQWIDWLNLQYATYTADVVKYEAERTLWEKFVKYEAPAPGLFGPTADPDAPKAMSIPRELTQPAAPPAEIAGLKSTTVGTTVTAPVAKYRGAGFGAPAAMMLVPIVGKTVRPFGTLAGAGQFATTTVAVGDADKLMSVRRTSNYKDSTQAATITSCDKSYLMITSVQEIVPPTAAKKFVLTVTASKWAKNLEEQVPSQPGAVTKPTAAPAGASQLAASAVAAALTALYLF